MKDKKYNSLGLTVSISVPETVEEYNALAGRENAAVDDAVDNTVYRSVLAEFREKFCEEVEKETGIARKRSPVLDDKGEPKKDKNNNPVITFDETEGKYIARVLAEKGYDDAGTFQAIADAIATNLKFDPSVRERTSGGGKVAKTYVEAADKIIAMGEDKVQRAVQNLSSYLGREVASDRDSLAAAIKAREDKKRQEQINDLVS